MRSQRNRVVCCVGLKGTVLLLCDVNPSYVILISYAVRARETQGSFGSLSCTGRLYCSQWKGKSHQGAKPSSRNFNEYFTNITKDLIVHKHTAFRDQAHINRIPMTSQRPANTFDLRLTTMMLWKRYLTIWNLIKHRDFIIFRHGLLKLHPVA